MSDKKIEPYYQRQAKDITNILYDKGFIADDVSRESIDGLEEYLGFIIQSHCETAVTVAGLSKRARSLDARSQSEQKGQTE